MKLISKVTEIYCIADDFCKEYELELNTKALSLSNPSPNTPKTRNRKGRDGWGSRSEAAHTFLSLPA